MSKDDFRREFDRHLTEKETEPWEILCFKAYKSQLPVIEEAVEKATLMLGSDRSRSYCLEMICADFIAGVSLENGDENALVQSLQRMINLLSQTRRKQLVEHLGLDS